MEITSLFSLLYGMSVKKFVFNHHKNEFTLLHQGLSLYHKLHNMVRASRPHCLRANLGVCFLVLLVLCSCDGQSEGQRSSNDSKIAVSTANPIVSPQKTELSKTSLSREHDRDIPRIVAFGDSLTAGFGVSSEESYPSHLQRLLDKAGYRYKVINAGVSGETTAGGLRRLPWVLKSHPKIVILELGANDGLRGHPLKETYANLEQIVQGLQQADVQVVLAGMKMPPNYGLDYTTEFESMYEQLARQYRVTLVPFFLDGVAAQPEFNQADGLHPTGEGYQIIVQNMMPILEPLLLARDREGA